MGQWAAGSFRALLPIELLPAASMPGAAGAYAISTGTIYFNADWLATASQQQRLAGEIAAAVSQAINQHMPAGPR